MSKLSPFNSLIYFISEGWEGFILYSMFGINFIIFGSLWFRSSSLTASNGKHSWLNVLKDLITESNLGLKGFPLDWLNKGISGYNELDLSKKLILLNFICDEALGTK